MKGEGDLMKCYFNLYCEEYLDVGNDYHVRGYKKDYGLIEVLCKDGKYRWFNEYRFKGGVENETYWRNIGLGHNDRGISKLDSYPSGNYAKWYKNQNGNEC